MKIEKTTTGLIIREPTDDIKRKCLQYFSLNKPTREFFIYSGNDIDNKPIFGKDRDVLYVSSGFMKINDPIIKKAFNKVSEIKPKIGKTIKVDIDMKPRSRLQKDCIDKLINTNSEKITVELRPGTGKRQPYSSMIPTPTPNGYTRMGDLVVGDYVFSRTGKPTKILGIYDEGIQDVYKVTFSDGRTVLCGPEHLWLTKTNDDVRYRVRSLKTMMVDYFTTCDEYENTRAFKYHIPLNEKVLYPKRDVPIDPLVLGYFIGKGDLTSKQLRISFKPQIISDIENRYDFKTIHMYNEPWVTFMDKNDKHILTSDFFKDIPSMINMSPSNMSIPDEYLYNDVDTRVSLLKGLIRSIPNHYNHISDGIIDITYHIKSKTLLRQMTLLLNSFGLVCETSIDCKRKCYLLTVDLSDDTVDHLTITNIEYSHREECRCILVDDPEHLYLTDNYIVTHNTFISLYSISNIGTKPLIIVPTTMLKNQWIESLTDMGIDKNNIATTIFDSINKDFCVVTISSLENALRDDWYGLMETIDKAQFGIRITDEAHLHLKGLMKLDAICNIKRNWYLSATLGRSDIAEDRILNRALLDADRFVGNSIYDEYQHQYVKIYLQDIHYHPSAKLCDTHFKYGTKGLVRSTYYNMLMHYRGGKPFIANIITMIKRAKSMVSYGKILILVPLISTIEVVLETIEKDSFFNKLTCAGVDGSMSLSDKREALECDIIISTSMSMGVGVDISDLSTVINFDQYASPIITEQIVGRLRTRKDDKNTHYFDICDHVKYAKTIANWGRKRRMLLPYFPGVMSEIKRLPTIRV